MFYVYSLADPRDGSVFYIGKGKGARMFAHAHEARKAARNSAKLQRIREIHKAGLEPITRKVAEFADEAAAFAHEAHLIATLPGLTNIFAGGRGGWALTKDEAERREKERERRRRRKEAIANHAWLKKWLAWVETWPNGGTFPTSRNGDELADLFIGSVRELVRLGPFFNSAELGNG